MITQEQIDWLAVEVMGWLTNKDHFAIPYQAGSDGSGVDWQFIPISEWQPDSDIAQAFMLLDKFGWWYIENNTGKFFVDLAREEQRKEEDEIHFIFDSKTESGSLPLAICKAVLKASGYKETDQ